MTTVIVGVGIPGSGKTTILKALALEKNYVYICPDDIRTNLGNDLQNPDFQKKVWGVAENMVEDAVSKKNTVVFDATFTKIDQRREFVEFLKSIGAKPLVAIFFNTLIEIAKQRNSKRERQVPVEVLEKYYFRISKNPPSLEDGFDMVITLDDNFSIISTKGHIGKEEDILISDLERLSKLTVDRFNQARI